MEGVGFISGHLQGSRSRRPHRGPAFSVTPTRWCPNDISCQHSLAAHMPAVWPCSYCLALVQGAGRQVLAKRRPRPPVSAVYDCLLCHDRHFCGIQPGASLREAQQSAGGSLILQKAAAQNFASLPLLLGAGCSRCSAVSSGHPQAFVRC